MKKITLKKAEAIAAKIEALRGEMQARSDEELSDLTAVFKARYENGEPLEKMLPEAFAAVREASRRVLGMEHFKSQLIGGTILFYGDIAEMKTGEGKTLVATCPTYLAAIAGKGVHVVTTNDYLAKRDSDQMSAVYGFMGLTTGCVLQDMQDDERRAAYACDITYVTNSELGFDYLRDNMVGDAADKVLRGLHFAIIDEVDSILIDEARTPLIISGKGNPAMLDMYKRCNTLAEQLVHGEDGTDAMFDADVDYIINLKDKTLYLTDKGTARIEAFFGIENLADEANTVIQHSIITALRAHAFMHLDEDYIIKDGEVCIVDEFTGRVSKGRRWSDGLHQAIEVKEGVEIHPENKTLATITFQHFFNMFEKKSGMSGTALLEQKEFREVYNLGVVVVPTNRPVIREDMADVLFKTKRGKMKAVAAKAMEIHKQGRPVLIGTLSIGDSEMIARELRVKGITTYVLNAKNHALEAEIVAKAGQAGTVTIATNMAGRGTDIKLDAKSKELGGLYIIGTERAESRRIDDQLRGRAGRQGDPGTTVFYLSCEDNLMKVYGKQRALAFFGALGIEEDTPIQDKNVSKTIYNAQQCIEGNNYGARKSVMDFDSISGEQLNLLYAERDAILAKNHVHHLITGNIEPAIKRRLADKNPAQVVTLKEAMMMLSGLMPSEVPGPFFKDPEQKDTVANWQTEFIKLCKMYYDEKYSVLPKSLIQDAEKRILLGTMDKAWRTHIEDLAALKDGCSFNSLANMDPVATYRIDAYDLYNQMVNSIWDKTIARMLAMQVIETERVDENGEIILEHRALGATEFATKKFNVNLD